MQWVADNADHNVTTLNGSGTIHGMGAIYATVLPYSKIVLQNARQALLWT
jgi:hypothetical protein